MCTAITLKDLQHNSYFGRTMDFSYVLEPSIYVCPRDYILKNSSSKMKITNKYSFMGIGQNISSIIFADGVNEHGFAVATLYFPNYASYDLPYSSYHSYQIDSLQMVNFLLGNCKSVEEAYHLLEEVSIVGIEDSITKTITPLHWITTDKTGNCMVIEKTAEGLKLWSNPLGVLSNSPNFEWHMTNLQNFMNLSPLQYEEVNWDTVLLTPFGQGTGTFGLPGDFTPPSRFVRASFLKTHVVPPKTQKESISTFFHIMESVSIPKGIVITQRASSDYTQYTSCMDLQTCSYFFKTYDNSKITQVPLVHTDYSHNIIEIGKLKDFYT